MSCVVNNNVSPNQETLIETRAFCLIKNIPPQTFKASGNRGVGFPTVDDCGTFPSVEDEGCILSMQVGNRYPIKQENNTVIFLEEC